MSASATEEVEKASSSVSKFHFRHPTDPAIHWCGARRAGYGYKRQDFLTPEKVTCSQCLHLRNILGSRWWWKQHRAFFNSKCFEHDGRSTHDCSASR